MIFADEARKKSLGPKTLIRSGMPPRKRDSLTQGDGHLVFELTPGVREYKTRKGNKRA